tara:strand:- start:982 stop:1359 length:378 start_codon:yes stop_codon:yes gene_type:complete
MDNASRELEQLEVYSWRDDEKVKYLCWDSSSLKEVMVHPKEFMMHLKNALSEYSSHLAARETARIQKILRSKYMSLNHLLSAVFLFSSQVLRWFFMVRRFFGVNFANLRQKIYGKKTTNSFFMAT